MCASRENSSLQAMEDPGGASRWWSQLSWASRLGQNGQREVLGGAGGLTKEKEEKGQDLGTEAGL